MAEVRFGDVVFRNGQGYSERKPTAREVLTGTTGRSGRSGGGSSSSGMSIEKAKAEQAQKLAEEKAKAEAQKQAAEKARQQAIANAEAARRRSEQVLRGAKPTSPLIRKTTAVQNEQLQSIQRTVGPTRETYEQIQRMKAKQREGTVTAYKPTTLEKIKDLPSKTIEIVTGKKPREAFRFITGSKETDITKPLSRKEVVVESLTVPSKALSVVSAGAGYGAEKLAEKTIISEEPYIKRKAYTQEYYEPEFGTRTTESGFIKREVKIPEKVYYITPEKVGKTVSGAVSIGGFIAAPTLFAPGMVAEGTSKLTDTSLTTKQRAYGGVEAAFGATVLTSRLSKIAQAKVVEVKATRPIAKPQALEVQKPITIGEKQTTSTTFEIWGETSPPMRTIETTRLRSELGARPISVTETPAKGFTIETTESIIGDSPFLVSEAQTGKRFATISRVDGSSQKISLEEFESLPKLQKYTLQKRAEEIVGRPVPLNQVPKILSAGKDRAAVYIESEKLIKLKPGKSVSEIKLIPEGKRMSRATGTTEQQLISKGEKFDILKSVTTTKQVPKPFARAAGKKQELETTIVKLKPTTPKGDEVKFVSPADIKKTPMSKTFSKSELKLETPKSAKVELPKMETPKTKTTIVEKPKGIVGSIYAGLGKYEFTQPMFQRVSAATSSPSVQIEDVSPAIGGVRMNIQTQEIKPEVTSKVSIDYKQDQPSKTKQESITILKPMSRTSSGTKQKVEQAITQIQKSIQKEKTATISIQKPITKLREETKLRDITKTITQPKQPTPSPTKIKVPIPFKTSLPKRLARKIEAEPETFEGFIFKGGQKYSIGKGSEEKVSKELSKKLKGTLAASGFLTKGGKKIKATESGLLKDVEFRVGKRKDYLVVEKKGKRLRKSGTGKTIQMFRGKGKSKKTKSIF